MNKYINECHERLAQTDYLARRGISAAVADKFKLGFDPGFQNGPDFRSAVIIPTGDDTFIARNTDSNATDRFRRSKGKAHTFNIEVLRCASGPVFLTEGELDAVSIYEVGGEALALGSVTRVGIFLKELKEYTPTQPLIISLDNDKAGADASDKLQDGLEQLGIPFIRQNICGDCKDANEALVQNRDALKHEVEDAIRKAASLPHLPSDTDSGATVGEQDLPSEPVSEELAAYLKKRSLSAHISAFLKQFEENGKEHQYLSTGLPSLDEMLGGGFYPRLYTVFAGTGFGKSTLMLEIANKVVKNGVDVLYLSYEMKEEQLFAKSISSLMYQIGTAKNAIDDVTITNGGLETRSGDMFERVRDDALKEYCEASERMFIFECGNECNCDISHVKEMIEYHIKVTGHHRILVIIDYLQAVAQFGQNKDERANIDDAIRKLEVMSANLKIPVVCIASVNRLAYSQPTGLAAGKGSGQIEYTSEVVIGMQYNGMDEAIEHGCEHVKKLEKRAQKAGREGGSYEVQLKMLKNRYGPMGECVLNFRPKFSCFYELSPKERDGRKDSEDEEYENWELPYGDETEEQVDLLGEAFPK